MPDINVGAQIFDLVFHPRHQTVYAGLLTGEIKAFTYDEQGNYEKKFSIRPSKKSCRGLTMSESGDRLWAAGKNRMLLTIDTATGEVSETRKAAHDVAINRVKRIMPNMLATGDDDGVVKLWDPRKPDAIRAHTHHFDFISDFLWLEDKKHLVCTSGDGTLSVLDVRSKRTDPFAQSEDQEDELLSVVAIKGGQKLVVGTQIGILSVFNRKNGYGDCVDRIPGHPHSIDALCNLPSTYPSAHSTILTGSSDGLLRAVQLFPTKLLGVVADHGEFPIERIAVDLGGEGRWVGSAGHEEVLKLTDLREVFEDEDGEGEDDGGEEGGDEEGDSGGSEDDVEGEEEEESAKMKVGVKKKPGSDNEDSESEADEEDEGGDGDDSKFKAPSQSGRGSNAEDEENSGADEEEEEDSSSDEEVEKSRKRKKKKVVDPSQAQKRKKGRNEMEAEGSFFAGL